VAQAVEIPLHLKPSIALSIYLVLFVIWRAFLPGLLDLVRSIREIWICLCYFQCCMEHMANNFSASDFNCFRQYLCVLPVVKRECGDFFTNVKSFFSFQVVLAVI